MSIPVTVLWFRHDLRLADHEGLTKAAKDGAVIPVYIHDTTAATGGASHWWLHEALADLAANLKKLGLDLVLRHGDPAVILPKLLAESGAKAVSWGRCYEPLLAARDEKLAQRLQDDGIKVSITSGFLLFEPGSILNQSRLPFRVFTPFSKACFTAMPHPGKPLPAPKKIEAGQAIRSDKLADLKLVPARATWPKGLAAAWQPAESAAHKMLDLFIDDVLMGYKDSRDRMDQAGTSRMSPYLHFGQISPRQVWYRVQAALAARPELGAHAERYVLEILWREFSWHLLHHFPHIVDKPLMPDFARFPWHRDDKSLLAWQKGQTGYPIVDAAMRQLWQTGWMHNRARMIVASFLVKHLLIDWRCGMAWFWDTLVDADLGSNTASWQWVAGCGADAAPYFRIFNPMLQGQKFDPDGEYVRRYVPELAKVETRYIHEPWEASPLELAAAGVTLGKTYPLPIIEHEKGRQRALAAFNSLKGDKT